MKRLFDKARNVFPNMKNKLRSYWRTLMASRHRNMSEGAQEKNKIITRAHGDNWRRHEQGKK